MLVIGSLSQARLVRVGGSLTRVGQRGKQLLGVAFLVLDALMLSRTERQLEAWLKRVSRAWPTTLTSRYCAFRIDDPGFRPVTDGGNGHAVAWAVRWLNGWLGWTPAPRSAERPRRH